MALAPPPETPTELLIKEGFDGHTYCLQCCGEYIAARDKGMPPDERPAIQLAATTAPSWQTQILQGQMFVACVPVPTCFDHLVNRERTPEEIAAGSGLALGGHGG